MPKITQKILGDIPINEQERIRISLIEKRGQNYLDMRIHFYDDEGNLWGRRKAAITVSFEDYNDFMRIVAKARDELERINSRGVSEN